jgi:hypothetical protein
MTVDRSAILLGAAACWLLAVACAASALWLAFAVVPALKEGAARAAQEIAREHAQSEAVITHALASAMFAGDYGDAQDLLDRYAATGYFSDAAVINRAQRVVASVGATPGLVIGNALPGSAARTGRRITLGLRSESYGQLVVFAARESAAPAALEAGIATLDDKLGALAWISLALVVGVTAFLIGLVRRRAA